MTAGTSTYDTLVLNMAEDAWEGDAEFTVAVDGVQVGGIQTVTAPNAFGQYQPFTIHGDFGTGPHVVAVTFLNDAYGGSPQTDRNLYLDSLTLDGTTKTVNANVSGTLSETVTPPTPTAATDTLTVNVSEDAYAGNAEFYILVDGVAVGGVQTTTALHSAGASQNITVAGNFGSGKHTVAVQFINDAYGGSAATDRNLYVNSITYDGTSTTLNTPLYSNGSTSPTTVSDVATIARGAVQNWSDTVVLELSEDAYLGNAEFMLLVDGKPVGESEYVTALNSAGAQQQFTFTGNFGPGPHTFAVAYLNDAWGGNSSEDRNLYVKSVTVDGSLVPNSNVPLFSNGSAVFNVTIPDSLVIYVSEDYYLANAQFSVTVDGKPIGGTYTSTVPHLQGADQAITLSGYFGAGPHTVAVTFLNDANGGSSLLDRNLYVIATDYNGVYTSVNAPLYYTGATSTTVVGNSGTPVTPLADMSAPGTFQYAGVNLSGLEFGGPVYPGTLNTDYVVPTNAEINYYASEGMNIIRLPFDWERLQPVLNGPLNQNYLSLIDGVVNYAATKGITVDLDVHNYAAYYGNSIGSAAVPNSAFADLWSQVAAHYAAAPNVIFGLMNEPDNVTATNWLAAANGAIAAIRAAGANQEILVPGAYSDTGSWWTTTDDASVMTGIVDPKMNFAVEIHQYLSDGTGSITSVDYPTIGVDRLEAVTQWAEANGIRLFLGEFGAGTDPTSLTAMQNMLNYLSQNTNVWQGVTEWGGGPWWGSYPFATDPVNGVTQPQIALLQHYT
jgi:endoglucanase